MAWELLIAAHVFISAFTPIVLRWFSLKFPKIHYLPVLFIYLGVSLTGLIVSLGHSIITSSPLPNINSYSNLWPLLVVGVFIPLSWITQYKLIRYIGASNVAVATMLNFLFAAIFAIIFLNESVSGLFIYGSLLLICGILISSFVRPDTKHKLKTSKVKILLLILLMSFSFGIGIMSEKIAINDSGIWNYMIFGWFSQLIGASIFIGIAGRKEIFSASWPQIKGSIFIGIIGAAAGLTFISALSMGQLSNTVMASTAKVTLTALLAAILLKERNQVLLRILAIILAILGLWLVTQ